MKKTQPNKQTKVNKPSTDIKMLGVNKIIFLHVHEKTQIFKACLVPLHRKEKCGDKGSWIIKFLYWTQLVM